ncbi:DoxX family membrane protein [Glycomyces albus]
MASTTSIRTPERVDRRASAAVDRALAVVRIALGWVFLWAFLDKTFGLGYSSPAGQGWIDGASPTSGFLASRDGALGDLFQAMAGKAWADWGFMVGMAGLGIALTLGIAMRPAAIGGSILMVTMWASMLPLEQNPFLDVHLFYALTMIALAAASAGDTWGLGRRWARLGPVRSLPILR